MTAPKRIHLVGIGGVGMSAIARVLIAQGATVSGSDVRDGAVIDELRNLGALIHIGHDKAHVDGADELIFSSAISADNPEVQEGRRRGVPLRHRSEMLADLLNGADGIAVAGAHGKTTVTAMIAWCLVHAGVSPTFLIGGQIPGLGGARAGDSRWLVAEADESDGSFVRYEARIAVVTGIEPDHLENFNDSFTELKAGYAQFMSNVKTGGLLVIGADDSHVRTLAADRFPAQRTVTYGLSSDATYRGTSLVHDGFTTGFHAAGRDEDLGRFTISVPGRHNVQNALACIAVCDLIGVDVDHVRAALATFRGAKRRFEVLRDKADALIIDDYAHHPSEIQATIRAAKDGWDRRVIAVFQPHRYSRTHTMMDELARSFDQADRVVITDVYAPPPEKPIPGASGLRLAALVSERIGKERVVFRPDLSEAVHAVRSLMQSGDIVVTMGAGDIWKAAHRLAEELDL